MSDRPGWLRLFRNVGPRIIQVAGPPRLYSPTGKPLRGAP